jgi:hypothetical protein
MAYCTCRWPIAPLDGHLEYFQASETAVAEAAGDKSHTFLRIMSPNHFMALHAAAAAFMKQDKLMSGQLAQPNVRTAVAHTNARAGGPN